MSTAVPALESAAALERLRARYARALPTTLAALERLADQLADGRAPGSAIAELRRELHRVRGSSGSYGFHDASRITGELEARSERWSADPSAERGERAAVVRTYARQLAASISVPSGTSGPAEPEPAPAPDAPPALRRDGDVLVDGAPLASTGPAARRVLLLGWSEAAVRRLRAAMPTACLVSEGAAETLDEARLAQLAPDVALASARAATLAAATLARRGVPLVVVAPDAAAAEGAALLPGHVAALRAAHATHDGRFAVEGAEHEAALAAAAQGAVSLALQLAARTAWDGARLVVLDDDAAMLDLVRSVLAPRGIRVVATADPATLDDVLARERPTLLLLDVHLGWAPGGQEIDGIALTRRLRADPAHADLPIVLFSTDASPRTRAEAIAAGASELIPKPVVPDELRARLEDRFAARRARLLADGRHPATGLPLLRRFLAALDLAGCRSAIGVVRAPVANVAGRAADAWFEACLVVADALQREGAQVGHRDEAALIACHPGGLDALAQAARLAGAAGTRVLAAPGIDVAWHVGLVAGDAAGAAGRAHDLLRLADEAERAARGPARPVARRTAPGAERRRDAAADGGAADDAAVADASAADATPADAPRKAGAAMDGVAGGAVAGGDGTGMHVWSAADAARIPDVLVVEDDPHLGDLLSYALGAVGVAHRVVRGGPEALRLLLEVPADGRPLPLVLLDVDLPGLNGHALHERARAVHPELAVVFTSGHGSEADQLRALRAGALDYVVKPVSVPVILAKLPGWLARARLTTTAPPPPSPTGVAAAA